MSQSYADYVSRCCIAGDIPIGKKEYELQYPAGAKPTNPKDMVGIRKVPFSVLPTPVLWEASLGMMEGALKYGRHNYRAIGVRASVYYDATQRHLTDWWEGTDIDPASRLHHITKAISSLMVLRDAQIRGMCEDDRPPATDPAFLQMLNDRASELVDIHADKNPKHYTNNNYKESDGDSE